MKISPKEFAELLKNSTLDREQRQTIIKSLKDLSPEQLEGLVEILKTDSDSVKHTLKEMEDKQKEEIADLEDKIKDLEVEEE